MTDNVRVGIIGTSYWADFMLQWLTSHPQAVATAICGRNRARADEVAAKFSIAQVFTDYREMLAHGKMDAVIIATPDGEHYPMTMAALEAGLHVLGEKPMAFNLDQARAMLAKTESAGVTHMINYTWRWMPHFRYLQQLVAEGFIGPCYDAHFRYQDGYARGGVYQWKWDRQSGLGILGDLGSHMIDLARLTMGDIAKVHACLATHVDKPRPDGLPYEAANDSAVLTLQSKSGAQGIIEVSAVILGGFDQYVCLHGKEGTLKVNVDWNTGFVLDGVRGDQEEFQKLDIPSHMLSGVDQHGSLWDHVMGTFTQQLAGPRHFIDCILQDKPVASDFRDGVKNQAVIDAAFESDRTGCWADVQPV